MRHRSSACRATIGCGGPRRSANIWKRPGRRSTPSRAFASRWSSPSGSLAYANPAQRYFLTLHSLPEDDPWRRCGQTEEWFAESAGLPPPKTLGTCRRATERPHLDGDSTNRSGNRPIACGFAANRRRGPKSASTYDPQFLYLAIRCPKAAGVDYSPDDRPRPRDADLAQHDRVTVRLDVDRDYTTAFELTVDHRGWTRDACWGDATWNPTWFVAAAADESAWTVEAAIPLAELVGRAAGRPARLGASPCGARSPRAAAKPGPATPLPATRPTSSAC